VIAANQDAVFRRLCAAMGRSELAEDERFAGHRSRADHRDEIEGAIGEWAAGRDAAEIDRVLNEAGVACGPIYSVADIVADPHFRERDMLVTHHDAELGDLLGPGIVPKFSATPGSVRWSGPWQTGAHNREIYGELLGLGADELAQLEQEGVI
jgi:crotonobetainyl-CoA:carnitine CoA-transferase CaiB-like acyl-CoA transferase